MPNPTTLVLLPGLDGTEVFFEPLLASLPRSVRPLIVCFPTSGSNEYADLLATVREAVSAVPNFYVLGWSFSGPLALMLAAAEPAKVRGVILSATFVHPPRPIYSRLRFAAVTPVMWTIRVGRRVPVWLFRGRSDQFRCDKAETWRCVSADVLAKRVRAILSLDAREHLRRCPHPVLYIAGSHDEVVPQRNVEEIVCVRPSVHVRTIAGRHFAMYTNPKGAADVITEFITQRESP